MRTLGVLGGMSWTSTVEYYRLLNQGVADRLGGLHSAPLVVHSVDFDPVAQAQHAGDWDATAAILVDAARGLERAGVDGLLLATNTMHKVAANIEAAVDVPFLHIGDATVTALRGDGVASVGLLATAFTMEQDFYVNRLQDNGIRVTVPDEQGRADVHRVIYDELCHDVVRDESRARYREVIDGLGAGGAEAVVLGCTEIGMLIGPGDSPLPTYDTTRLHAQAGVDFILG